MRRTGLGFAVIQKFHTGESRHQNDLKIDGLSSARTENRKQNHPLRGDLGMGELCGAETRGARGAPEGPQAASAWEAR